MGRQRDGPHSPSMTTEGVELLTRRRGPGVNGLVTWARHNGGPIWREYHGVDSLGVSF